MLIKKMFPVLVLLFFCNRSDAQLVRAQMNPPGPITRTMLTFGGPYFSQASLHRLRVILENKTSIEIGLDNLNLLNRLPDIDSLLQTVWAQLQPLKDSFPNDLNNRRVDFIANSANESKIRLLNYEPQGTSFVRQGNDMTAMKLEQDTLRIVVYLPEERNKPIPMALDMQNKTAQGTYIYYKIMQVTLAINNLSEIPELLKKPVNGYIKELADNCKKLSNYKTKQEWINKIYVIYEPFSKREGLNKYIVYKKPSEKMMFLPQAQVGIQNVRNGFAPSVSLGFAYGSIMPNRLGREFALYWEPYFFFDRNAKGNITVQRNDFVTFQYYLRFQRNSSDVDINLTNVFSIGYLVNRDGDYFNKNTFKIGLPGMEFRNFLIQPQFFFNDFFKQFYPSLRFRVQMD
jgi:hypothetical protein